MYTCNFNCSILISFLSSCRRIICVVVVVANTRQFPTCYFYRIYTTISLLNAAKVFPSHHSCKHSTAVLFARRFELFLEMARSHCCCKKWCAFNRFFIIYRFHVCHLPTSEPSNINWLTESICDFFFSCRLSRERSIKCETSINSYWNLIVSQNSVHAQCDAQVMHVKRKEMKCENAINGMKERMKEKRRRVKKR